MTDKKKSAVISFRAEPELQEAAQDKAKRKDLYLGQVLRRLLRRWVHEPNGPPGEGEE